MSVKSKVCATVLFVALTVLAPSYAAEAVANSNNLHPNKKITMTRSELLSILMTNKVYWDSGTKISVFILPKENQATKDFLFRLGIPYGAYFDSLNSMYSSGKQNVPVIVESDISMLVRISTNMGAIGYVGNVDLAKTLPNVRLIEIVD